MATPVEGGAPRGRVVAIWCCLLVLVVLVIQAARVGAQREQREAADRPWIGLPVGGTDITEFEARRAVEERLHVARPQSSLARECRADGHLPDERYLAWVAPGGSTPPLQVMIDVNGDAVTLSPPAGTHWPDGAATSPPRFLRAELKGVREGWSTPLLWGHDMPSPAIAADPTAAQVRLEACVQGGYALRTATYGPDIKALYAALSRAIARR